MTMICLLIVPSIKANGKEDGSGTGITAVSYEKEYNDVYTLSVSVFGEGELYDGSAIIKEQTNKYEIKVGESKTLKIVPSKWSRLDKVILNDVNITNKVKNESITVYGETFNQNLKVYFTKVADNPITLSSLNTSGSIKTGDPARLKGLVVGLLLSVFAILLVSGKGKADGKKRGIKND